jgi:hypothetical protein
VLLISLQQTDKAAHTHRWPWRLARHWRDDGRDHRWLYRRQYGRYDARCRRYDRGCDTGGHGRYTWRAWLWDGPWGGWDGCDTPWDSSRGGDDSWDRAWDASWGYGGRLHAESEAKSKGCLCQVLWVGRLPMQHAVKGHTYTSSEAGPDTRTEDHSSCTLSWQSCPSVILAA